MNNLHISIMAGGLGKRMKSELPKVLHLVYNKPMLVRVIEEALKLEPEKIYVIVGKYKPIIEDTLKKYIDISKITFVIQEIAKGTGHAIQCTLPYFEKTEGKINLILSGDVPLIKYETMKDIINNFKNNNLQIVCTNFDNPHGFGRIVKKNNKFIKIVEEKDCLKEEKKITLCNAGIYLINVDLILKKYLPLITNDNAQNEYYLTDIVEITINDNPNIDIDLFIVDKDKQKELTGINTKEQLEQLLHKN